MAVEGTRNVLHFVNLWRMSVLWVLAILRSYAKLFYARFSSSSSSCRNRAPQQPSGDGGAVNPSKAVCIVTGASSGIGKASAEAIAIRGYYVVIAGRSMSRLCKAVEEIRMRHLGALLKPMELDLTSVPSILKFTQSIEKLLEASENTLSLQLLINNAGILATTERKTSKGYECMMMTNYLGHYILTQMLLPIMQKSIPPARIVNVGSFTHYCVTGFEGALDLLQNIQLQRPPSSYTVAQVYPIARTYETSKLFMILFTYELHHRMSAVPSESRVTAMAADPGIVDTRILRELPAWLWICITIVLRLSFLMKSPSSGCKAVVDAALSSPEISGKYFFGGHGETIASSAISYDRQVSAKLWRVSKELFCDVLPEHKIL